MDFKEFVVDTLCDEKRFAGNPIYSELTEIIQNGDMNRGKQLAEAICKSRGITLEQGIREAKQKFGIN